MLLFSICLRRSSINEKEELADISSMLPIYSTIAQQTQQCADFIVHYSETKSFWKRLRKHVINETNTSIQSHGQVFDDPSSNSEIKWLVASSSTSLAFGYVRRIAPVIFISVTMPEMPGTLFKLSGPPFYTPHLYLSALPLLQRSQRYLGNSPQSLLALPGLLLVICAVISEGK